MTQGIYPPPLGGNNVKAKDHPAYQYHLTNHYKLTKQAEQLKRFHDSKKGQDARKA